MSVEAEGDASEQSDLGVGGLDESLRETVVEGRVDGGAVRGDALLEVHECGKPRATSPRDPVVERFFAFGAFDGEDVAQRLFEQVGPPQPRVGLGDPIELVSLSDAEITGVLPQRIAGAGDALGIPGRAGMAVRPAVWAARQRRSPMTSW